MTPERHSHERCVWLASQVLGQIDHSSAGYGLADAVCAAASQCLDVDGAAIAVGDPRCGLHELVSATGEDAVALDECQFVCGEGPSVAAVCENRPVMVTDLSCVRARWPGFTELTAGRQIAAVLSFPLTRSGCAIGSFDLHRTRRGPLTSTELADAFTLTNLAELALLCDYVPSLSDQPARRSHYSPVHIATGMIAVQQRLPTSQAALRLRAYAFAHYRSPREVARDVLAGRLRLEPPPN